MGIFDSLRTWFSPKSPASDAEQELRRVLQASVEIVSAFGAALEQKGKSSVPTINSPETDLPCSKQSISQAISNLKNAIRDPNLRAFLVQSLSLAEAQRALSPKFEQFLEVAPVLLDTFVPAAQVEAERKQWEDALKLVETIDPGGRARIENTLAGEGSVPPKRDAT